MFDFSDVGVRAVLVVLDCINNATQCSFVCSVLMMNLCVLESVVGLKKKRYSMVRDNSTTSDTYGITIFLIFLF